ncbi:UDP-N-acetylmuramate--L-alanine ligase [Allomuricauda ruestringensis DSM 13258]|uniref:UDP-N-acetylmuramate--L-alanine ligase n=1 Tax=Allomuricauda ruestringensis (strain DSM 13258 / CIP 107369 / LMG 19739 / B1) TaxID=886377 RepID=G2PRV5_ALLRU|nr:Mur ligase domain-containing protein [Allomuricauda ruestringensis]AEM69750.1 UDP-N-acetylmuramate--L-alanine ligase [Allomuricauda ruestringensis DSM 13258]
MGVHFIGLGEVNMFNLAYVLHQKGEVVTGSDEAIEESLRPKLKEQGLLPEDMGWFPSKIQAQLDAVVLGSNAKKNNPELEKAQELGLKIYSYPDFLYELTKYKTRVVVAGSQRKTSVASMILHVLEYNNIEVDYALSATNGIRLTEENDFIVIEGGDIPSSAIDSAPQFHLYRPNIALLSDIEWDDKGSYGDFENYTEQYRIFVDSIVKGGSITYNDEDMVVKKLVEASENPIRKLPYVTPDYQEENGGVLLDTPDGELPLETSSATKLSNLAGAKWICQQMGVDEVEFYEAIATYQ